MADSPHLGADAERRSGRIIKLKPTFGFIRGDGIEDDVFFTLNWVTGVPYHDAEVSFVLRVSSDGRPQAHDVRIESDSVLGDLGSLDIPHEDGKVIGRVKSLRPDASNVSFGFISSDDFDEDAFFHISWVSGKPYQGAIVTFAPQWTKDGLQAHDVTVYQSPTRQDSAPPRSGFLLHWAYLGYLPDTLEELKTKALDEDWDFATEPDPERPYPILHSYLINMFARLTHEYYQNRRTDKIMISDDQTLAAFHTGLVDHKYEPIYAVFEPNEPGEDQPWHLAGFCIEGERGLGTEMWQKFPKAPSPAHFFDEPADLIYDTRAGAPTIVWNHVIVDNTERLPTPLLEDNCPRDFEWQVPVKMGYWDQQAYFERLGAAIERDGRAYKRIMTEISNAVDMALKRVSWNYKTAIPQYYTKEHKLQLLLPLFLTSDSQADAALAVERNVEHGTYIARTIFPLAWAYRNARLVCRPESDWLDPKGITLDTTVDPFD